MSAGKMAAQAAHAAIAAFEEADDDSVAAWTREGCTKIVLCAKDETHLDELLAKADKEKLPFAMIRDAGRTEVAPGTVTCLAIGPGDIDSIIGSLPVWKDSE